MKKQLKNNLQMAALGIAGICFFLAVIYGMYWVAKTVSYQVFYEDMVQQTIAEMVDAKYLRKAN